MAPKEALPMPWASMGVRLPGNSWELCQRIDPGAPATRGSSAGEVLGSTYGHGMGAPSRATLGRMRWLSSQASGGRQAIWIKDPGKAGRGVRVSFPAARAPRGTITTPMVRECVQPRGRAYSWTFTS